jgi:hypothetical protein
MRQARSGEKIKSFMQPFCTQNLSALDGARWWWWLAGWLACEVRCRGREISQITQTTQSVLLFFSAFSPPERRVSSLVGDARQEFNKASIKKARKDEKEITYHLIYRDIIYVFKSRSLQGI